MVLECAQALCDFLDKNGIIYRRFDHRAVFTCAEARANLPHITALETKNLFLRDHKGQRHFLLSLPACKHIQLQVFAAQIGCSRLSFGSADRLKERLNVLPGAVTLMALINDPEHRVELYLDEEVWNATAVQCHPLVNTATLAVEQPGLRRFFELTGHKANIVKLPGANGSA